MEQLPQHLMNAVGVGAIYGLIALGLTLVFSVMRLVNMAHGEHYMVGAYITWWIVTALGGEYWLGFLAAIAVGAGSGVFVERLLFRPIQGKPLLNQFIVSLGLLIILQESVFLAVGGRLKSIPGINDTIRHIGSVSITDQRLIVIGIAIAIMALLVYVLHRTRLGKSLRAAADNKLAAGLVGIDFNHTSRLATILGISLASVAGALLGPVFSLSPFMGSRMVALAFVIIVTGGMGSIFGAILASFIIGLGETLFAAYISIEWSFAVPFVVMLIVLAVRPMGLLGRD